MRGRWWVLGGLCTLVACGGSTFGKDTGRVLPQVAAEAEEQHRFAMVFGQESGVSITVTERPWSASTNRVAVQHSALFVQLHHEGAEAVRYREDDFVLRAPASAYPGVPIDRLVTDAGASLQEARVAKTTGIRATTLEPGQSDEGFVFFRKKFALPQDAVDEMNGADNSEGELLLELTLFDVAHETALETLRLPLVVE